jgi:hypothetical protein
MCCEIMRERMIWRPVMAAKSLYYWRRTQTLWVLKSWQNAAGMQLKLSRGESGK